MDPTELFVFKLHSGSAHLRIFFWMLISYLWRSSAFNILMTLSILTDRSVSETTVATSGFSLGAMWRAVGAVFPCRRFAYSCMRISVVILLCTTLKLNDLQNDELNKSWVDGHLLQHFQNLL